MGEAQECLANVESAGACVARGRRGIKRVRDCELASLLQPATLAVTSAGGLTAGGGRKQPGRDDTTAAAASQPKLAPAGAGDADRASPAPPQQAAAHT